MIKKNYSVMRIKSTKKRHAAALIDGQRDMATSCHQRCQTIRQNHESMRIVF
jgi:hypothetical protein